MTINKIVIFGVGAAGGNLLINLIHSQPSLNYLVVDFDVVELRNIIPGTQIFEKSDIKRPKVQAAARVCSLRGKKIEILNKKIETKTDLLMIEKNSNCLFVDCFDNAKSRNLLRNYKISTVHIGFSGLLTGEVCWDECYSEVIESKADKNIDVCELHLARPFIQSLTGIAALIVSEFLITGQKRSVYFDSKLNLKIF